MLTITSSSDIDALFREGQRAAHPLLVVLEAPTPAGRPAEGRVVFVAGKRIGDAVLRNRCKRVLREAVRRAGGPWPARDMALVARTETATARPEALDAALARALTRLGVEAR